MHFFAGFRAASQAILERVGQEAARKPAKKGAKRLFSISGFVDFSGLFWPIFDSFSGGNIRGLILPPENESKIGSKEPENRQKLSLRTVSKSVCLE